MTTVACSLMETSSTSSSFGAKAAITSRSTLSNTAGERPQRYAPLIDHSELAAVTPDQAGCHGNPRHGRDVVVIIRGCDRWPGEIISLARRCGSRCGKSFAAMQHRSGPTSVALVGPERKARDVTPVGSEAPNDSYDCMANASAVSFGKISAGAATLVRNRQRTRYRPYRPAPATTPLSACPDLPPPL